MSDARNASDNFMEEWQKAIRTRIFWDLLQQIGTYIHIFQRRGEGGCWSKVMCKGEEGGRVGVKGMEQSTLLLLVNQVCLTSFYWHEGVLFNAHFSVKMKTILGLQTSSNLIQSVGYSHFHHSTQGTNSWNTFKKYQSISSLILFN